MVLLGSSSIVMTGPASNKLLFTSDDKTVMASQLESARKIAGKYTIFELNVLKLKQMRLVYMGFLKPDRVRACIEDMDRIVKLQLAKEFFDKGNECSGKQFSAGVPPMKHMTFDVAFLLIFVLPEGLPDGKVKEE
ncbi:hypothetical protein AMTR_s00077p00080580 [Amborella trichopoda]|uniref:Uncharacterized protein n=1 Tax=Amborella trichopoda TaxID=13333 RepID=W1P915_AMBTC|nr:hypothetical protein AMTR_s00077p00080580 [Amborella trichopoda]